MADGPKPVASMTGAAFFGISRTVDAERQTGIRAVGDASGCSGGTMGFHRCRCARCLYERGEGPKPPPVLPGVEFATAKADPAPSAEYAAECRGCEACPDGICSRHHPDDREAAMKAHPERPACRLCGRRPSARGRLLCSPCFAEQDEVVPLDNGKRLVRCQAGCRTQIETRSERAYCELHKDWAGLADAWPDNGKAAPGAHTEPATWVPPVAVPWCDCGGQSVLVADGDAIKCRTCDFRAPLPPADPTIAPAWADPAPKAAPVDPYEAHAIKALADAADDFIVKLGEDEEPKTRAEALAQAEEALTEGRRVLAFATAGVARLEAAIAEHGRKAGG